MTRKGGVGGRKGEERRGVFHSVPRDWLRADAASFSRVNSRVSRKMRRGRDGKHDGERGGAFIASSYEPTFRGRYVVRPGFPDLFHNLLLSLSLPLFSFFFHFHHYRPLPPQEVVPTFSFIDCLLPVNPHQPAEFLQSTFFRMCLYRHMYVE